MKAKLFSLLICSLPVSVMAFGVTIDSIAKQKDTQAPTPPIGTHITLPAAFGNVNSITISKEFDSTPSQRDLYKAVAAEFTSAQYYPNQISITEFAANATSTKFTAMSNSPAYVAASFITVNWTYKTLIDLSSESLFPVTPVWGTGTEFNAHPTFDNNLGYEGNDLNEVRQLLKIQCPTLKLNQVTLAFSPNASNRQYVSIKPIEGSNIYKGATLVPLNTSTTPLEDLVPINMGSASQNGYTCQSSGFAGNPWWPDYSVFNSNGSYWHYDTSRLNPTCPIPGHPVWEYNGIQLPVAKTAMFYSFAGRWGNGDSWYQTPTDFDLLATNDTSSDFDWGNATVLDSRRNQPIGTVFSYRHYPCFNTTPFLRYRLAIYSTRSPGSTGNIYPIMARIMFWGL